MRQHDARTADANAPVVAAMAAASISGCAGDSGAVVMLESQ
jgi:hypothetical protein